MTKIDNHKQDLFSLFEIYFQTNDAQKLKEYVVSNSNLPSSRTNLELAQAFADLINLKDPDMLWIVKENLKKNRLVKNFPEKVESIKKLLP